MKRSIIISAICALGVGFATPTIADESLVTQGKEVEQLIAEYFPDNYRTMRAIAKCESGLIHRANGKLLRNAEGGTARGIFQLLMRIHGPEMKRLGLNPNDDDDYMKYIRHLYDEQGLAPWKPSKHCWKSKVS